MMKEIKGGCTPAISFFVEIDPNPNGNPVLWLCFNNTGGHRVANAPLNREAVNELIIELQKRVSEM